MCFSAPASFIAGASLSVVGVATIRMTKRKSEIPFAAIPLFFGIQQLIEGMIWLSFNSELPISNTILTFLYSLFSHVFWPLFVPFAILLAEPVQQRKKFIKICLGAGAVVGFYLLYNMIKFPITSHGLGKHSVYETPHFYIVPVTILYLVATCVSGMISSHKIIRWFGILSLLTFLAAYSIHAATFVSVWCFFAAILSFMVYLHFRQFRHRSLLLPM